MKYEIEYARECTSGNPCGECQGDCNGNRQCVGELRKMMRFLEIMTFLEYTSNFATTVSNPIYFYRRSQVL